MAGLCPNRPLDLWERNGFLIKPTKGQILCSRGLGATEDECPFLGPFLFYDDLFEFTHPSSMFWHRQNIDSVLATGLFRPWYRIFAEKLGISEDDNKTSLHTHTRASAHTHTQSGSRENNPLIPFGSLQAHVERHR